MQQQHNICIGVGGICSRRISNELVGLNHNLLIKSAYLMMAHKRTLEFSNVEWSVFLKKIKEQHTMATDGIESDKRDLKEVQEVSALKWIKRAGNSAISLFLSSAFLHDCHTFQCVCIP